MPGFASSHEEFMALSRLAGACCQLVANMFGGA